MIINSDRTMSSTTSARGAIKSTPAATTGVSLVYPAKQQRAAPSQAVIAQRAYEIWLSQGQEQGCEQKHWFDAEQQLRHG